ncbi:hypothetical protein WDV91_16605 [Curtobacterium flaccumfaciens pv. flaccumfaciens]
MLVGVGVLVLALLNGSYSFNSSDSPLGLHVGVRHREALGDVQAVRVLVGRFRLCRVGIGQCGGRDAGAAGHHHRRRPERHDHHGPRQPSERGADRRRLAGRLHR